MPKIVEEYKKGYSVFFIMLITAILLSWLVYGSPDLIRAIRSRFIVEVVIPILGALITFGGISLSIF